MTNKNSQKLANAAIAYFATLILLSTTISACCKYTDSKKSLLHAGLALTNTAFLGAVV